MFNCTLHARLRTCNQFSQTDGAESYFPQKLEKNWQVYQLLQLVVHKKQNSLKLVLWVSLQVLREAALESQQFLCARY